MSWAKGTITSTAGNQFQLEYKLSAHTPEQSEKVFRERLIEQTGKRDSATAAKSEPVKPEAAPPAKTEPTAAAIRELHDAARALMQQATAAEQRANAAEKSPENRTCCENLSVLFRRLEGKPANRWGEIAKRAIKVAEAGTEDAKGQPRFVATRTARDIRKKLKKGQSRETIEAQTAKALRTQFERNSNPPKRKRSNQSPQNMRRLPRSITANIPSQE